MNFYCLSPLSVPENQVLFPIFRPIFIEQGHSFVGSVSECDIVLWDMHTRIADYNQNILDEIIKLKPFVASFDEFDKGGMSYEVWPYPLTDQMKEFWAQMYSAGISSVNFCRLIDKTKVIPSNLFPFEKPYFYDGGLLSEDEIWDRPYDIVWIANTAPQREHLKKVLEVNSKLKCKIILGAEKIPLQDWIDAHKQGKMFVSWSAGGFGDEKIQHLFSVAAIIKENNNQLFLHDFTHLENCIRPNPNPTREDIETIIEVVNDKSRLYEIYKNGCDFVKKYYSKEYIASNILETILKHL